jgi:hypothetical protein
LLETKEELYKPRSEVPSSHQSHQSHQAYGTYGTLGLGTRDFMKLYFHFHANPVFRLLRRR